MVGAEGVLRVVPARIPDAHGGPAYAARRAERRASVLEVGARDPTCCGTGPRASAARLAVPGLAERGRARGLRSHVRQTRHAYPTDRPRRPRRRPRGDTGRTSVNVEASSRRPCRRRAPRRTSRKPATSTPPIRSPLPLGSAKPLQAGRDRERAGRAEHRVVHVRVFEPDRPERPRIERAEAERSRRWSSSVGAGRPVRRNNGTSRPYPDAEAGHRGSRRQPEADERDPREGDPRPDRTVDADRPGVPRATTCAKTNNRIGSSPYT